MSIKSTQEISREEAIIRIQIIVELALKRDYKELESKSFERDHSIEKFVQYFRAPIDMPYIDKWTNRMLENVVDKPFYRKSMFDNYLIS